MEDRQKVYIQGNSERGDEVIKTLEDIGGSNFYSLNGQKSNNYYFINSKGVIDCTTALASKTYSFLKEFYKKIELPRWMPEHTGRYFYINSKGEIIGNIWCGIDTNEYHYKFGNCFRTKEEAEVARDKIKELLKQ